MGVRRLVVAAGLLLWASAGAQSSAFGQDKAGSAAGTQPARPVPNPSTPPATSAPAAATPAAPATSGSGSGAAAGTTKEAAAPSPNSIAPGVTVAAKALAVKPGHYALDTAHGKISWSVNHLGFSTYGGQFAGVTADLQLDPKNVGRIALTASVDMASVGTLNPKLDGELAGDGFFNTKAFPKATFKSSKITITGPQTARIDGDLTLKGHTFPIVISATFNNAGVDPVDKKYTVGFDGASIIRRSTFGVTQYVPFVGDLVTLRIEGEFKPAS